MSEAVRRRIAWGFGFVGGVLFTALFFGGFFYTTERVAEAKQVPPRLSTWTVARVKSELGAYDQLARGEQSPLGAGSECLVYQKPTQRAVILVCEAEGTNK